MMEANLKMKEGKLGPILDEIDGSIKSADSDRNLKFDYSDEKEAMRNNKSIL